MASGANRKRNASMAGFDASSPASMTASLSPEFDRGPFSRAEDTQSHDDGDDGGNDGRRRPVKRACNECRQQKLRCDVVQEPFQTCSRCRRLRLECKIEDNFKRVGKRSRNAEMEREIVELRKKVAQQQNGALLNNALQQTQRNAALPSPMSTVGIGGSYAHDAAAGLLDLRTAFEKSQVGMRGGPVFKKLEDVPVSYERAQEMFQRFFTFHHPFLPFLAVEKSPEEYFNRSPLLFWVIIAIGARHYAADSNLFSSLIGPLTRLIWTTLAEIPQNYHVVKALILICAFPLPTSSTSTDPSLMFCGMMMQVAMQIGLHRPNHAQDFTKFRIELREVELQDRVVVWCACNITAQRICTAYGQPPLTLYDWNLGPIPIESNPNYTLPSTVYSRLLIEKFVDKVTKTLYMNPQDPVGLATDHERPMFVSFLTQDLTELQNTIREDTSPITNIYLKAAILHMRLSAFFSPPTIASYRADMLKCYTATIEFLEVCLNLESESAVSSLNSTYTHGLSLTHGTNYIFHMMLAAGFSLLKLMYNFLGQHELDTHGASELLTRTLWTLRSMSVIDNDLPERLSEVLTQVWKSGRQRAAGLSTTTETDFDTGLQLKVKCRMSMSVVFDSVWRWRRNFRFTGAIGQIQPDHPPDLQNMTSNASTNSNLINPTSSNLLNGPSSSTNIGASTNLTDPLVPTIATMPSTTMIDDFGMDYGQANYEVFDPLNWMLDGLVDFPYGFGSGGGLDIGVVGAGVGGNHTSALEGGASGSGNPGIGGGGVVMGDSIP